MAADLANPMKEQADHAMGTPWMWPRRSSGGDRSRSQEYANGSWEEQAFAEDAGGHMGDGSIWPPRSYSCTFCRREFRSAQALGGHMNVHRRDRALLRQSAPGGVSNPPEPAGDLNAPANSAVVPILNGSEHHLLCSRYADYCSHNSFVYCSSPSTIVSVNRSSPYPAPVMYSYPKSNASGVLPDDPDRRAMSAIPSAHLPSPAVVAISPYCVPPVHFMPPFYSSTGASDPSPLTVNAFEVSKESSDSTGGVISEVEGPSIVTDSLFKDDHEGTLKKLTIGTGLRPMTYDLRHDENASDVRRIRPDAMEDSADDLDLELRLGGRPLQVHHK